MREEYSNKLFFTTGSPEFIKGLNAGTVIIFLATNIIYFKSISFPFVIPEMREKEYFEQTMPKLIQNSDLSINHFKGLLHFHTTYSDARNSLKEMITEAQKEGFEYAPSATIVNLQVFANRLNEERVFIQKQEIIDIALSFKLHIFQGMSWIYC